MKLSRISNMGTDKLVFVMIGGFTVVILVLIVLFSINEGKQNQAAANITNFSVNDKDKPEIAVSSTFSDLGNMKVKDEKSAEFTIENKGTKSLSLFKISSSCDCTFGQITIDGSKSPEFGMHSQNSWTGSIAPGKKALLNVTYKPYIMPVKGVITRDIYMQTNDPQKPQLTFTVKAFVE
ncbi:DUF1573 domain-containing protein [Candidatus Gottesmanbacteria bacterium]|nr:DUF1573 domain-containing protein [Candidatus Gottesmanbacteria bacterium]